MQDGNLFLSVLPANLCVFIYFFIFCIFIYLFIFCVFIYFFITFFFIFSPQISTEISDGQRHHLGLQKKKSRIKKRKKEKNATKAFDKSVLCSKQYRVLNPFIKSHKYLEN